MSYAIRKDGQGWRAVNSPDDVTGDETFSETQPLPPTPSQAEIVSTYEVAVQASLDAVAASWQYESILSATSYANSTVPKFKSEALALIAWRDQVWAACYSAMADIEAGNMQLPVSPAAFIATLPAAPVRPS